MELSSAIDSCSADIVGLTETWLSAKVKNEEILDCEKCYKFYRCDRDYRSGGGVLLAVTDSLASHVIPIVSSLELVCARVLIDSREIIFCVCYRPPTASLSFCNELHDVVNQLFVRYPKSPLFLLGDFNFPDIRWERDSVSLKHNSAESKEFLTFCHDFNLTQLVHFPTRITSTSANILDLILTTTPDLATGLTHSPGISDHSIIHFTLRAKISKKKKLGSSKTTAKQT